MPQLGDHSPVTCPDTPLMLIGREPGQDGSYGRPSTDAELPRDPWEPSYWLPGQGPANACGTTTLTYILKYLLGAEAPERTQVDSKMRRADIFSAPMLLASYARSYDLSVRVYNNATIEMLRDLVTRGVPVMVLTDTTPLNLQDTANLHWVSVVAMHEDKVAIYNPHGYQEEVDLASFESHWREARLFGLPAWRNFMIAITRDASLLPPAPTTDFSVVGANLAASGVASLVNGGVGAKQSLSSFAILGLLVGLGTILLGLFQVILGVPVLLLGALAGGPKPAS
ncbi:MAG: C39 family peptidase [Chloroflexota bacterium]